MSLFKEMQAILTETAGESHIEHNTRGNAHLDNPCRGAPRPVHSTGMLSYLSKLMPFSSVSNTCSSSSGGGGGMYRGTFGLCSLLTAECHRATTKLSVSPTQTIHMIMWPHFGEILPKNVTITIITAMHCHLRPP